MPSPSFEPKTHRWCPGAGAPRREVPSQNCTFCAPKPAFLAHNGPGTHSKRPNEGKRLQTLHVRLDCPVTRSSLLPSNSTTCPRNSPKMAKNGQIARRLCQQAQNQERAVSWATWLKTQFRGHLVHPQPPTFCGFQPSESPNETPRPPYRWSVGGAGGQLGLRTVGANGGSTRVPGAKKIIFSKAVPRPLGMLKVEFLARFEPMVMRFGSWKIPKCLENGPF